MARRSERWTIEKLVPGGAGFTRLADGRAAFVDGALPGDVIEPLEREERPGHVRAKRFKLLEPGSARIVGPCPVADACGGCDWMKLERQAELTAKADLLRQAFERTGGFQVPKPVEIVSAGPDLGYRSRIRLHVDRAGRIGFHARGSNEVVEIPSCVVAASELNLALAELRRIAQPLRKELAALSEIELRHAPRAPELLLIARLRAPDRPPAANLIAALEQRFQLYIAGRPGRSQQQLQRWPLFDEVELAAPPDAFTQVNWDVNRALVKAVVDGARARGARRFCDVYAGAGNFSLALLAAGLDGISIERNARAVEAARLAAGDAGLSHAGFRTGDVRTELARLVRTETRFDLLIFDPPRSGAKTVLGELIGLAVPVLAAIGCDPVTLARDLKTLHGRGYELVEVTGYDMFPHTHHVETLAWLARPSANAADVAPRATS